MRVLGILAVAAGLFLAGMGAGRAATFECPATLRGAALDGASPATLFYGMPEAQESIAPETTTKGKAWTNRWDISGPERITAVCQYAGGGKTAIGLPPALKVCTQRGEGKRAGPITCR